MSRPDRHVHVHVHKSNDGCGNIACLGCLIVLLAVGLVVFHILSAFLQVLQLP